MSTMTIDDVREMLGRPSLTSKPEAAKEEQQDRSDVALKEALAKVDQLTAEVERLTAELEQWKKPATVPQTEPKAKK